MTDNDKDLRYEQLYSQMYSFAESMHESNKRRIRRGLISLIILPFVLGVIIWLTDSDRIVFLIIWVVCMFAISAYLISVEYLDDTIQKTLKDVTDREAEFDRLLFSESIPERLFRSRLIGKRSLKYKEEKEQETEAQEIEAQEPSDQEPSDQELAVQEAETENGGAE